VAAVANAAAAEDAWVVALLQAGTWAHGQMVGVLPPSPGAQSLSAAAASPGCHASVAAWQVLSGHRDRTQVTCCQGGGKPPRAAIARWPLLPSRCLADPDLPLLAFRRAVFPGG